MTTDTLLGLDGQPLAVETKNPYRVAREPKPRSRRGLQKEAQGDRLRGLIAQGFIVKIGTTGVTVFSFDGGW